MSTTHVFVPCGPCRGVPSTRIARQGPVLARFEGRLDHVADHAPYGFIVAHFDAAKAPMRRHVRPDQISSTFGIRMLQV